jgi:hypothetical protein
MSVAPITVKAVYAAARSLPHSSVEADVRSVICGVEFRVKINIIVASM